MSVSVSVSRERFEQVVASASSNVEAGRLLGMRPSSVACRCCRLGIATPAQRHGVHQGGVHARSKEEFLAVCATSTSIKEAAERLGVTHYMVTKRCRRLGIPTPTDRERERFIELCSQYEHNADVARVLGVCQSAVSERCRKYGIPTPSQRARGYRHPGSKSRVRPQVVAAGEGSPGPARTVYLLETRRHAGGRWICWQRLRVHRYRQGELLEASTVAYWDLGEKKMSPPEQQLLKPAQLRALVEGPKGVRHEVLHPEFERQVLRRVLAA